MVVPVPAGFPDERRAPSAGQDGVGPALPGPAAAAPPGPAHLERLRGVRLRIPLPLSERERRRPPPLLGPAPRSALEPCSDRVRVRRGEGPLRPPGRAPVPRGRRALPDAPGPRAPRDQRRGGKHALVPDDPVLPPLPAPVEPAAGGSV